MEEFERVAALFASPIRGRELAAAIHMPKDELEPRLAAWQNEGLIMKREGKWAVPAAFSCAAGRLQIARGGFGFLIAEDGGEDVFLPEDCLLDAINGDRVLAQTEARSGGRREGRVIKVLRRAHEAFPGVLERRGNAYAVKPDDNRIADRVLISRQAKGQAIPGDRVWVEVTRWKDPEGGIRGRVAEVLGRAEDPTTGISALMREYRFESGFPAPVLAEAQSVPQEPQIPPDREDFRHLHVFTIDGEDAKDLDDAVALEPLAEGYRLYVHIADVSHYVRPGSAIDAEALRRGTSVYFPGRVLPMLPVELSNGICSLNGGVDRLVMSAIIDFDAAGSVRSARFAKGVIRSNMRMTYSLVTDYLENRSQEAAQKLGDLTVDLDRMWKLARTLERRRQERGGLDFDVPEPYFKLDERGWPTDVYKRPRSCADRLIESFMLAANESVARYLADRELAGCFRVHEEPDGDKLSAFTHFLDGVGLRIPGGKPTQQALQGLLHQVEDQPEEGAVNRMMLRAMQKARYAPENLGHYGLGAKWYCHFTSPIRRYPDLLVHRMLKECIEGRMNEERAAFWAQRMPDWCKQCSDLEKNAERAERDGDKLFICYVMKDRIGELFDGTVSGINSFGIFVELPNTAEGLLSLREMPGRYQFDEANMRLVGPNHTIIRLGDRMPVKLIKVDVERRLMDFTWGEKRTRSPSPGKAKQAPPKGAGPARGKPRRNRRRNKKKK